MYAARLFAVRHAAFFERLYQRFEHIVVALDPAFRRIGYGRLENPVAAAEKLLKGLLFDCQMCGQCVLSSTGMSCPMNCPKQLRNGPCGGVREGGFCEVKPEMRCVWVEAWQGAARMDAGAERILIVQPPVDRSLEGSSAWLRVARERGQTPYFEGSDPAPSAARPDKQTVADAFKRARQHEPASAPLATEPVQLGSDPKQKGV